MNEKTFFTGRLALKYAEIEDESQAKQPKPALVLLHGGSARWQYLEELMQDLSKGRRVYAPDLRGHGKSGRAGWGYSLRDYAEDTAAFLRDVSGPAFLYGHSLGGVVALMTAGAFPENVRAFLVGDAPLDAARWKIHMHGPGLGKVVSWRALSGGSHSVAEIVEKLKEAPEGSTDPQTGHPLRMLDVYPEGHGVYLHLAERLFVQDPDVLGMLIDDFEHAAAGFAMKTLLPAIRCPVLLMQADPDAGGVMSDAEVVEALPFLDHPVHVKFKGLSHLLNIEDPERVTRVMEDFLTSVPDLPSLRNCFLVRSISALSNRKFSVKIGPSLWVGGGDERV